MTAKQLSELTGVPIWTIRRMAERLDGFPVGGRHGWEFPSDAPKRLKTELRRRHLNTAKARKEKDAK